MNDELIEQNPRVRGDVSDGAVDQLPYYGEKLRKENGNIVLYNSYSAVIAINLSLTHKTKNIH